MLRAEIDIHSQHQCGELSFSPTLKWSWPHLFRIPQDPRPQNPYLPGTPSTQHDVGQQYFLLSACSMETRFLNILAQLIEILGEILRWISLHYKSMFKKVGLINCSFQINAFGSPSYLLSIWWCTTDTQRRAST